LISAYKTTTRSFDRQPENSESDRDRRERIRSARIRKTTAALAYLRNRYDHTFDLQVEGGFIDPHRGRSGCLGVNWQGSGLNQDAAQKRQQKQQAGVVAEKPAN
jgi:hypothetical protein